ncbi:DUF3231 family protein [Halobacillus shinanisalinarum]|uniref:DUF3231 family protein n=1 Tax=Halobacillus shinanisalinarum TaxID=2932258 RepID=A0ABY4GUZ3_9BACI|nr:DUF3231 family protein [Halobacillus shinanisalinarum]UOQ91535.1 DUF3231 family protein [Halobacillus shinanisalinarum]
MEPTLTPSEISNLWNTYLGNTMGSEVTNLFRLNVRDEEIHKMLDTAQKDANEIVDGAKFLLNEAKHPLPESFDENDVNRNASPQFTDNAVLLLKHSLTQKACMEYSAALTSSTRGDVRNYFVQCLTRTKALLNTLVELVDKKGLNQPKIHIPIPGKIEKVQKQSFLGGFVKGNRPLTSEEIRHLVFNFQDVAVMNSVFKAFSQMTESKEIKEQFNRGVEIGNKHLDIFQSLMNKNDLPNLPTWESEITDSIDPSFSDRVILFKTSIFIGATASNYGKALSTSFRKDLGVDFLRLMGEWLIFGEDNLNIMIKRGFLDQMPLAKREDQVDCSS